LFFATGPEHFNILVQAGADPAVRDAAGALAPAAPTG
jgi:hypothetical protein